MTKGSKDFILSDGLVSVLLALVDGPTTGRALANRLQRPVAAVLRDLEALSSRDLVAVDGSERLGGVTERCYRLPTGELHINLTGGLPVALKEVQRGIARADLLGLPATASLVAVRLAPAKVDELLVRLTQLRNDVERDNLQEGVGTRFSLFLSAWSEE